MPELLAALDRHRAVGRTGEAAGARLARARSQVFAIVAERLEAELRSADRRSATGEVLAEVAEHRLDPYSAADRLLESLSRRGD